MLCTRRMMTSFISRPMYYYTSFAYSTGKSSWIPVTNVPVQEFAHSAFFSLDRPLLDLYNKEPSTTTITLDISRDGQCHISPHQSLAQDQVADYLVAMQQKWSQIEHKKKRRSAKKQLLLLKRDFFEKN
ncbi:uncharacterized protein BX664DRAFT_362019 [Halteromyces radiatus]|uniref:uncharacterized protein n=1 Tax=Halteromyces radiatus TaxID=101107 RepID=UPI002220F20A|nr:uncharacterized protein BX664DRAFT_362019 [Halteromyces radiatus]KAI8079867.1 hypothetical protein BX664DRAFT_362019 [Halteromyces radiatus]